MLRFRLFLESRKVIWKAPGLGLEPQVRPTTPRPAPHHRLPTSLGSLRAAVAEGSLGLAMGKEKRRSMLEKSGSSTVASAQLSDAHMELCSAGRVCMLEGGGGQGGRCEDFLRIGCDYWGRGCSGASPGRPHT